MQTQQNLLRPFEPDDGLVFVKWFRSKSGKIIHASAYGKKSRFQVQSATPAV